MATKLLAHQDVPFSQPLHTPGSSKPAAPALLPLGAAERAEGRRAVWTWVAVAAALLAGGSAFAWVKHFAEHPEALDAAMRPAAVAGQTPVSWKPPGAPSSIGGPATPSAPVLPPLPPGTRALRWEDLTLMLRSGMGDEEILAESANRALVARVGPAEENALRGLGAGSRLLAALRARAVYAAPGAPGAPAVAAPRAPEPRAAVAYTLMAAPSAAPTPDHRARDRQIHELQTRMNAIDGFIRQINEHPDPHWPGRQFGISYPQAMHRQVLAWQKEREEYAREKKALEEGK